MNDRYRNVCKAAKKVFIQQWGCYVVISSEKQLKARIRKCMYKLNKARKVLDQWARSYYETTMQGLPIQRSRVSQ